MFGETYPANSIQKTLELDKCESKKFVRPELIRWIISIGMNVVPLQLFILRIEDPMHASTAVDSFKFETSP